jgi:hypothetical protein
MYHTIFQPKHFLPVFEKYESSAFSNLKSRHSLSEALSTRPIFPQAHTFKTVDRPADRCKEPVSKGKPRG